MKLPLISVPITSYNQADFIQEAILSAVEQDYDNLQVVVCDDVSTDNSRESLLDLLAKYPRRLEVHFSNTHLGFAKSRSLSFSLCKGELITYLDGDDIFLPGKIRKQAAFMIDRPDCVLCHHDVEVFDSNSDETIFYWKDRFGYGNGGVTQIIRFGNYLCSISFMFRKEHIPPTGMTEIGEDWLFLIQMLVNGGGKYCYLDEVLARYRRHSRNMTLNWHEKLEKQINTLALIDEQFPQFKPEVQLRRSELCLTKSVFHLARQEYLAGFRQFCKSLAFSFPAPWHLLRMPLRELRFWIHRLGRVDPLVRSLLGK